MQWFAFFYFNNVVIFRMIALKLYLFLPLKTNPLPQLGGRAQI